MMRKMKKYALMLLTVLICINGFSARILADDEDVHEGTVSYSAGYEFVLEDKGELPEEVMNLLPETKTGLEPGTVIVNESLEDVETEESVFYFVSWNFDEYTITDYDVFFTGTWRKEDKVNHQDVEHEELYNDTDIEEPENDKGYTVSYMFADATAKDGIGFLPDEIMDLLPEKEEVKDIDSYEPKYPKETDVSGYIFNGYEPYRYENGDILYQGIWYKEEARSLLKAPMLRAAGSQAFGYGGQQNWGLSGGWGYSGHNGFSIGGTESWCIDARVPLSEIGTLYDSLGSSGGRAAEIIAMGKMNGRSQAEIQAALWNDEGYASYVNGVYIDPNDSDFNSRGMYGYSVDTWGGDGLQTQAKDPSWWPLGGFVKVYKRAASTEFNYVANCPNNYSLAGAVYGIYSNSSCTSLEATVTTGSSGESNKSGALDPGTYWVKEISPSPGFTLDTNIYSVSVTAGNTSSITSTETPIFDPFNIILYKLDARDSKYVDHLDEAEFTVRYYDAQTDNPTGNPKYSWTFKPEFNSQGKAVTVLDRDHFVRGDDILFDEYGDLYLPLGTFTIEETLAPQLYARDENVYVGHVVNAGGYARHDISSGGALEVDNDDLSQREELQTVVLNIQKKDMESGEAAVPEDNVTDTATLAGGVFHVYRIAEYNTDKENPELVDITPVDYGTITTDETGLAELKYERINGVDTTDGLLPGKFRIVEEKAPNGYALKPTLAENTYILEAPVRERNTATFRYTMDVHDKLTRIQVEKLDQDGELVGGQASATIQLIETDTGRVVYEFVADGQAHIIRGLTTLLNYHLHELYVAPNYKLAIDKEVNVIDENDSELHSSADPDHPYTNYYHMIDHEVEIKTTATFSNEGKKEWDNQSNKHYVADGVAHIFDEVAYKNVYEGEHYKLVGELYDKTADVSLNKVVEKEFTPTYDVGIETLEFDQQLDDLDNHELVVFETLYRIVEHDDGTTEEVICVEHKDLEDEGQTIYVDELYRRDFEIHKVNADDEDEVLEGVTFNIRTYRVKRDGVVEDYDLGNFTTDADGVINIEKLKEDCKITVTEIQEKDPTWYRWEEALIYDIGHDSSITDALSETIVNHRIRIGTTARFEESDDKNYVADGVAHIIDTVDYEWLYEGDQYKLVATLIDKGTEDNPTEAEVTTTEHEFIASGLNGSEDVSIEFDFTGMDNHDFVVFEELYHIVENDEDETEEIKVAEHREIDDEGQTVHLDELYRAAMVLYKIGNNNKEIKLSGAYFNVKTSRTRRDGMTVEKDLGTYVTGGILVERDLAFKAEIYSDAELSNLIRTVDSKYDSTLKKQAVCVLDLSDGEYYVRVDDEEKAILCVVEKGSIIIPDQPEDTLVTFMEIKAPAGYYLDEKPYVCDVGHDYELSRVENYRSNSLIIIENRIPDTGMEG